MRVPISVSTDTGLCGCVVAGGCDCRSTVLCRIRTCVCVIVMVPVVRCETLLCFVGFRGCSCIEIHWVARRRDCG